MHDSIQKALSEQIRSELFSAYFYLSASDYFEATSLTGFAEWMREQSREEVDHAMKIFDYLHDRGTRATLQGIEQPPADFRSPLDVFTRSLEHERQVSGMINELYALSLQERDYPSQVFLQWYISEQVEEEKIASQIVEELKMAGDNPSALLVLNGQLAARRKAAS